MKLKVGSDFSGVGAFDQALMKLGMEYETIFACDMDKYARKTFIENYGEPGYYPENVYDRNIPSESLDIYMTSPPCQAFSLAGKRKGESDKRGVLFYNSHEFIRQNKPRYFIFENVKGLLSDDNGRTFRRWIDYLGGKSINGNHVLFPSDESVPYHIYYKVLNAKDYGVPQNRERIFIIGIRDDEDNTFTWPKEIPLEKRLKDVLESEVDEKYFLSDKLVKWITSHREKRDSKNKFPMDSDGVSSCITSRYFKTGAEDPYVKVKSATSSGFETATIGEDSINFEHPNSETRRGRVGVGVGVAQTLTTSCNQGVATNALIQVGSLYENNSDAGRVYSTEGVSCTLKSDCGGGGGGGAKTGLYQIEYRIRKLTPTECFRLMGFPDSFVYNARKVGISDSQLYKQAGNSIVVGVLAAIIGELKL